MSEDLRAAWRSLPFPPASSDPHLNDLKAELAELDALVADSVPHHGVGRLVVPTDYLSDLLKQAEALRAQLTAALPATTEPMLALSYLGYLDLLDRIVSASSR
jgi:hypothetical protein